MQTGIIRSLHKRKGTEYGFLTIPETGEGVYFRKDDGRTFQTGVSEPYFDGSRPPPREPRTGDIVVFERAQAAKGPRATPWGLYQAYRDAIAPTMERYLPEFANAEHPFLLDVLIAAKRLFRPGSVTVQTAPLTRAIRRAIPTEDLTTFKSSHFFVAMYQENGCWLVRELNTVYIWRVGKRLTRSVAATVEDQLMERHIKLWPGRYVLVRLDVDARLGLLTPDTDTIPDRVAEEERSLTVYL